MTARRRLASKSLSALSRSFGFDPGDSRHHFVVEIPRGKAVKINISEHFTWLDESGSSPMTLGSNLDGQIRVILPRSKWDLIAEEIREEFNQRLKRAGRKVGTWAQGSNLVRRELGREMVLLAWGIEDADPALIPLAVANWKGLVPEERWWLYTQTAAATGHGVDGRGKGWRKALRFALTENPVNTDIPYKPVLPEYFANTNQLSIFTRSSARRSKTREHSDF